MVDLLFIVLEFVLLIINPQVSETEYTVAPLSTAHSLHSSEGK